MLFMNVVHTNAIGIEQGNQFVCNALELVSQFKIQIFYFPVLRHNC